ncbi:MAG TPA: hypothetical protein ENH00_11720 [Actinobacteria bacterium]|nr:hypothetical protein [Actinomycetota bacterium]
MNSDEIDYAWRSHVMNGLISTDNPDLVIHRLKPGIIGYYETSIAPDLDKELKNQTVEAAKIFRKALEDLTSSEDVSALIVMRP